MNKEEIIEYNKRCAEFLGWKYFSFEQVRGTRVMVGWEDVFYKGKTEELKFHSDWNWIMEVVEAIENINRKSILHYNEIKIFRNHIDVSYDISLTKRYTFSDDYSEQALSEGRLAKIEHFKTKKEAVVQAINQFLIWYNKYI